MDLHFSDHYGVDSEELRKYGAFDISVASDLPLFIDPFLLFNSAKKDYQGLHQHILKYLVYLRDRAQETEDLGAIANLYQFREVKQNWLGFTQLGNGGHALGASFARSLHRSLRGSLANFGTETVSRSSHLEKLTLIRDGVGRDNISDFTTNLIKDFLCRFTQEYAATRLNPRQIQEFAVVRAEFNYETETWETRRYLLPDLGGDFVLLTPYDLLTRDQTWINHKDMLHRLPHLAAAVPDAQVRAQINQYFGQHLTRNPSQKEKDAAAELTINQFPELIDYYIRRQEESGHEAESISGRRVDETNAVFVQLLRQLLRDLEKSTDFFKRPLASYSEALDRARYFKHYIEQRGGFRLINKNGRPFSDEKEVQLFFGLVWYATELDVSREPETGRGPVDFKVSKGRFDRSLIEFKLASNRQLKRGLQKQVPTYLEAEQTASCVIVIVCYTRPDQQKVARVLKDLKLGRAENIVVIDARADNKPSASKA